jgi:CO/xanthine dehydrogenase FAD-binding subunit
MILTVQKNASMIAAWRAAAEVFRADAMTARASAGGERLAAQFTKQAEECEHLVRLFDCGGPLTITMGAD